jgi:rSAM/selenodomain-associated transferase 1
VNDTALLVIAKDPRPGRCKTRLCPPCRPEEAARLAAAALSDTLEIVAAAPANRRVLVLDGDDERWRRPGLEIIAQRGDGLAQRLANAFADVDQPALLVGMDTPQLTVGLLADGLAALACHDAALGPALDGGYWSIGLRSADAAVFADVPMSSHETFACQRRRLAELRLSTYQQPTLRDVDTIADARTVAALAPNSRFAQTLEALW